MSDSDRKLSQQGLADTIQNIPNSQFQLAISVQIIEHSIDRRHKPNRSYNLLREQRVPCSVQILFFLQCETTKT